MAYRSDIDGLRAIAVCIVIFFHFGIPGFAGGYIGVDVFFVISGYLIGSIILKQLEEGRFSFTRFYFRRVRRLFPVFVAVILVTTAVAYLLMLPADFKLFGQTVVASSVYLSNILFYLKAGYFDTASHLKPLLHTWSLSVEEQFYVIFPLLAWLIFRLKREWLLPILLVLTGASLVAAEWYLGYDNNAVFYLYPFRAWEMFLGVCLATQRLPKCESQSIGLALALAGLAMIVIPGFIYTSATPFPGLSALIPCVGTCLLIYAGSYQQTAVHNALSRPVPVFLGKISYSLYLWHWPIFVLTMYGQTDKPSWPVIAWMTALTLAASYLSWKYIETPFREGKVLFSRSSASVFGSTAIISVLLIAGGYYIHKTEGMPQRLDQESALFAQAANDLFGDFTGCKEENNDRLPGISHCIIGDPFNSDSYTLVWGDSHGGAYKRGFEYAFADTENPAVLAWTGGCPPVFDIDKDESVYSRKDDLQCPSRNQAIKTLIQQDKRINAVVMVGRWSYYLNGQGTGIDADNTIALWPESGSIDSVDNQADFFVAQFKKTVKQLDTFGIDIFAVEQVPEFSQYHARILALNSMRGLHEADETHGGLTIENYDRVLERQGPIKAAMTELEKNNLIQILPTHHYFCNGESCSVMLDGAPAYYDNNHVSTSGAVKISGMLTPLLESLERKL